MCAKCISLSLLVLFANVVLQHWSSVFSSIQYWLFRLSSLELCFAFAWAERRETHARVNTDQFIVSHKERKKCNKYDSMSVTISQYIRKIYNIVYFTPRPPTPLLPIFKTIFSYLEEWWEVRLIYVILFTAIFYKCYSKISHLILSHIHHIHIQSAQIKFFRILFSSQYSIYSQTK